MALPTAKNMATAMLGLGRALSQAGVCQAQSIFSGVATQLKSPSQADTKWCYEVTPANPIEFSPIFNKSVNTKIRPKLSASISVRVTEPDGICFDRMDVALDVVDVAGKVLIRHHVDLANYKPDENTFQPGPLFHLQFGGHTPKQTRTFEIPIKEPRWPCFPMDLVLVCEVIVANFYPEAWEKLRNERHWREAVITSQQFCLSPFLKNLAEKMSDTKRTVLDHLWATTVGPTYRTHGLQT